MKRSKAAEEAKFLAGGRPPADWSQVCPGAAEEALELVATLLRFDPRRRSTAAEALQSTFLAPAAAGGGEWVEEAFSFVPPRCHKLEDIWEEIQAQATISPTKPVI